MDIRSITVTLLLFFSIALKAQTETSVTLSEVQVKKNGKGRNELRWSAPVIEQTDCFLIQRSKDGKQFRTIGRRAARKDENTAYLFEDTGFKGDAFYRIIEVTVEGKAIYSGPLKPAPAEGPKGAKR